MHSDAQEEQLSFYERLLSPLLYLGVRIGILRLKDQSISEPIELSETDFSPIEEEGEETNDSSNVPDATSVPRTPKELEAALRRAAKPAFRCWEKFNKAFTDLEADPVRRARTAVVAAETHGRHTAKSILRDIDACIDVLEEELARVRAHRQREIAQRVDTKRQHAEECKTRIAELEHAIAQLTTEHDQALATAQQELEAIDRGHGEAVAGLVRREQDYEEIKNVITPTLTNREAP